MGKSYRKPYSAVTGTGSAKQDKIYAHRGVRRAQKQALQQCLDWDDFLIPHKLECSGNETYSWGRDGKQSFQFPPTFKSSFWCTVEEDQEYYERELKWYQGLFRK